MGKAAVQQLNVRLDARDKRDGEKVLSFVGSSATEVIRALFAKIARGAADYAEVMQVLRPHETEEAVDTSIVSQGWSVANEFYATLGCDVATMHMEDRNWDEVYADAMAEHFCEKGLLQ